MPHPNEPTLLQLWLDESRPFVVHNAGVGIGIKIHGLLDYFVAIATAVSPWVLGYSQDRVETAVPYMVGLSVLIYSLMTDWETGVLARLQQHTHLRLDLTIGTLSVASPWMFDFWQVVWQPHVVFGLYFVLTSLLTRPDPHSRVVES